MAINRPSSGAGIWCPSCQDWAFGTPLPRTGDLVPPVRFRPRIMANLEVWYPDFCQLRRFGSPASEKCLVTICPNGFCGYQTLRFARRRVPNLRSRHEKVPNRTILPRKQPSGIPNLPSWLRPGAKSPNVALPGFEKTTRSCDPCYNTSRTVPLRRAMILWPKLTVWL